LASLSLAATWCPVVPLRTAARPEPAITAAARRMIVPTPFAVSVA
jgi:hypothetical protein